jgi:hypothetical protein
MQRNKRRPHQSSMMHYWFHLSLEDKLDLLLAGSHLALPNVDKLADSIAAFSSVEE